MAVAVRKYQRGGWQVDVRLVLPDGTPVRERKAFKTLSKSAAQRWGQDRERHLLLHGLPTPTKEVPTLQDFAPRFFDGHPRAERQKPSTITSTEVILRVHLVPFLGEKRLDQIANEDVQRLKRSLESKSSKTVNNVLSVLNTLLRKAVDWRVITAMPCTIQMLPVHKVRAGYHDFDQYKRLMQAAPKIDWQTGLAVLMGGEAGLRCGEMLALEWRDIDLAKGQLCVERADWNGELHSPKGGRLRHIPLTKRLASALLEYRHLRSPRVLCHEDGTPLTRQQLQSRIKRAARLANVQKGVHILRHSFCSHLAMYGAPARAIQELAGHAELGVTQRYMHLSPAALDAAIQLLDDHAFGNGLATDAEVERKAGKT